MPPLTDAPRSPGPRFSPRRLALVAAVWAGLVGSTLLVANALDSPVGAGARDEAQPAPPGQVETTTPDANVGKLPPFAMVLDHPLPKGVAGLATVDQAEELRVRAMTTRNPTRFVELGSVLQVLGDTASARFSYQSALKFDPQNIAAKVGLAVVDGDSPKGLALAATRLRALATAYPQAQVVSFNQAWVEIYRGRGAAARTALKRTKALGPDTRLGGTAAALLSALGSIEPEAP